MYTVCIVSFKIFTIVNAPLYNYHNFKILLPNILQAKMVYTLSTILQQLLIYLENQTVPDNSPCQSVPTDNSQCQSVLTDNSPCQSVLTDNSQCQSVLTDISQIQSSPIINSFLCLGLRIMSREFLSNSVILSAKEFTTCQRILQPVRDL